VGNTGIPYLDKVWNPMTGCTPCSIGCQRCYAKRVAETRLRGRAGYPVDEPFRVVLHPERLDEPLRWRKPQRVGVCFMGDLSHEDVPSSLVYRVWQIMEACPQHTFLVLTKRPQRLVDVLGGASGAGLDPYIAPLPNVWVGVTAESQREADERIPLLLQIPAAVRWVSHEPALGPVDIEWMLTGTACRECADWGEIGGEPCPHHGTSEYDFRAAVLDKAAYALRPTGAGPPVDTAGLINWVVTGAETGPGARPMDLDWARADRDACAAAGVPFWYKQNELDGVVYNQLTLGHKPC
jgi:protein gp37